jgi:hypothetical protein
MDAKTRVLTAPLLSVAALLALLPMRAHAQTSDHRFAFQGNPESGKTRSDEVRLLGKPEPPQPFEALFRDDGHSVTARPQEPRRTLGGLGFGAQFGGFFDPGDPALEFRGWFKRVGFGLSWGRHLPEPSYSGFAEVDSRPGKQVIGGLLFAFNNPQPEHRVPFRVYGTAGIVHATQARAVWEGAVPAPDGTVGEAAVEGSTGYWPFVGVGAEIGFKRLRGLAVGSELLFAVSGEGVGPGIRFSVRYYL